MAWMAVLVAVFMFLGLRDRTHGGSTHLTALVAVVVTLTVVFLGLGR
jgi:heme/copper-type cytochrome/quinol oxidase subunit 4